MKIAIHHRSNSYSEYLIKYCDKNNIDYVIVNCYSSNIIDQIKDCDALLWNWAQWHSRDTLFAKQLIYSVEQRGIEVYPNTRTCQFFDDKLGQKYLFESLEIPMVKSHSFFYRKDALKWLDSTELPIVWKLRGGASSVNVKLVNTKRYAKKLIRKAFSRGFSPINRFVNFKDRIYKFRREPSLKALFHILKGVIRIFYSSNHERMMARDKGYVYFQDFVPGCKYDIRVVVVGERAFAKKRYTRDNDFRASGSGLNEYDPELVNIDSVKLAFKINEKLKMQSVAFDFVERNNELLLIEISYTWAMRTFVEYPGYWNNDMEWIKGNFYPTDFIIEDLIKNIQQNN